MKKTYKLTDIANKLRKTRTAVTGWSNQYREFFPTVVMNGSLRYTEEALNIFEIISKMRDANKSNKQIKDHLQEMRQQAVTEVHESEQPTSPETLNIHNLDTQLNKETMELRNVVEILKQKLEANRQPKDVKDHLQDMVQKATIASKEYGTLLSPIIDNSNVQLNKEVIELRAIIQALTGKINEVLQQDVTHEITTTVETLNTRHDVVSEEVAELRNVVQTLTENVTEIVEQDIKSELIAIAESQDTRYDGVSVSLTALGNVMQTLTTRYERVSDEVTELRSEIKILLENVTDIVEQDIKSELIATAESLNTRYDDVSEEVTELRSEIKVLIENVTKIVEQDIKNELISTAESLNTRYDGMSEEVTELRSEVQTLTEKVTDIIEQSIKNEEVHNKRYDEIHQMMISQQELVVKIAKLLGFPAQYTS